MSRYIDADDAIYRLEKMSYSDSQPKAIRRAGKYLNAFANEQPADVEKVRHGEWLPAGICRACSECDFYVYNTAFEEPAFYHQCYHYCPNCGAKMDGGTK